MQTVVIITVISHAQYYCVHFTNITRTTYFLGLFNITPRLFLKNKYYTVIIKMSETNNSVNEENSDDSSIQFFKRKVGPRRRLSFSSDSSDCSSTNFPTNTLIGRKRSRNPDKWTRNVQKYNRTKGLAYRNRGGNLIPAKTFVDIACRCRQKCNQKILSEEREAAMKAF